MDETLHFLTEQPRKPSGVAQPSSSGEGGAETSAAKWSPVPVMSVTVAFAPGIPCFDRSLNLVGAHRLISIRGPGWGNEFLGLPRACFGLPDSTMWRLVGHRPVVVGRCDNHDRWYVFLLFPRIQQRWTRHGEATSTGVGHRGPLLRSRPRLPEAEARPPGAPTRRRRRRHRAPTTRAPEGAGNASTDSERAIRGNTGPPEHAARADGSGAGVWVQRRNSPGGFGVLGSTPTVATISRSSRTPTSGPNRKESANLATDTTLKILTRSAARSNH